VAAESNRSIRQSSDWLIPKDERAGDESRLWADFVGRYITRLYKKMTGSKKMDD